MSQALEVLYAISQYFATPYRNYFQTLLKTIHIKEYLLYIEHFHSFKFSKYRNVETRNMFQDHPCSAIMRRMFHPVIST